VPPGKLPGFAYAYDGVLIHSGVGKLWEFPRVAVEAVKIAAAADRISIGPIEEEASIPMTAVATIPAGGVLLLVRHQVRTSLHPEAERIDLEDTVITEAFGIALGVARVAAVIVAGIEVLNVDVVLR
jgi:hypothetical protein